MNDVISVIIVGFSIFYAGWMLLRQDKDRWEVR